MSDLVKKTVEEWVSEDDQLWKSPLWRSLFTKWGIQFAVDTDTHQLQGFWSGLTESCDDHCKRKMVCACHWPKIPTVNDLFTVTFNKMPVSTRWLRWGPCAHFLLTPALFSWPYSNFGGEEIAKVNETRAFLSRYPG